MTGHAELSTSSCSAPAQGRSEQSRYSSADVPAEMLSRQQWWYLQDRSGEVHVIKGQLIIVLRCIFKECLWALKCTVTTMVTLHSLSAKLQPEALVFLTSSSPFFFLARCCLSRRVSDQRKKSNFDVTKKIETFILCLTRGFRGSKQQQQTFIRNNRSVLELSHKSVFTNLIWSESPRHPSQTHPLPPRY